MDQKKKTNYNIQPKMAAMNFDPGVFKSMNANPGGTLELFEKYIERMSLIYKLAFRKADGTPYPPSDRKKKQCYYLEVVMT